MKRLILIVLALLLLTGCADKTPETTVPETTVPSPTEPPVPWIQEVGMSWNEDGSLLEIPLLIPDSLHYSNATAFADDLLLWSIDDHRENIRALELCLLDLDTGKILASREIDFTGFVSPQVMGDRLFLSDNQSGTVLELDPQLQVTDSWTFDPVEATLTMGAGEILYVYEWEGSITVLDLKTGEKRPLMDEKVYIEYFSPMGDAASFDYYHPVTGERKTAILDLITGQILDVSLDKEFTSVSWQDDNWLCEVFTDGSVFYISDGSGAFLRADLGYDSLRMIDGNSLLRTYEDGCFISLHDLSGKSIAMAQLTATPYSFNCYEIMPSETFGGYFLLIGDYDSNRRLLYWDVSKSAPGADIAFAPIPEPEEAERLIALRVDELEQSYGLNILVGSDCGTDFFDFSAEQVTDWELVDDALDTLENALKAYPEDFFTQLRYDSIHSIEIHIAGTLTATNSEYVDSYEAFVQEEYDKHVMVVDLFLAREQTYYHEFSHIIDAFLTWDAENRGDALFHEETWNSLNPGWFPGYTWDYSWQQYVQDYSCFIDSYSTIKPTEDRARVLEYAMTEFGGYFGENTVLTEKLRYYCRCIRDAFDTTGWPDTVLWEQYLP